LLKSFYPFLSESDRQTQAVSAYVEGVTFFPVAKPPRLLNL
jgi:hypothetical protein